MDRITRIIRNILPLDQHILDEAQRRLDNLTKPIGSLGKLEDMAKQICGITGSISPVLSNKILFTLAGDHGVTEEKVSPYPKEVTAQMVANFLNGGAGINVLARHAGARVVVGDLGVASDLTPRPGLIIKKINYGTKNIARGPAMTMDEAVRSIIAGIEIFEEYFKKGVTICGIGEMGIANTTPSSAITSCITSRTVEEITGRGAGLDDAGLNNKISVIKQALDLNKPDHRDPIDVLAKVGGFEIGGMAGIILASAAYKTPVILDGFISGAAALIAFHMAPATKEYMIASHCSVERGHMIILEHIGLSAILNLNLKLGEGTGAALGMTLADASIKILTQMATFES
ncbi:MAG: nicotinate-nucleotide--dimethylbenzimidazole phosphoribosyltransferase, partial [Candidatus Omnitrophota bacterium]